jgi:hypothetical protein
VRLGSMLFRQFRKEDGHAVDDRLLGLAVCAPKSTVVGRQRRAARRASKLEQGHAANRTTRLGGAQAVSRVLASSSKSFVHSLGNTSTG